MFRLISAVYFSTILVAISSAFLSDGVKNFEFATIDGVKNELKFDYKLDDGETFHGKSYAISSDDYYRKKFMMMGANNTFYWIDFTDDELESKKPFSKDVRLVEVKKEDDKLAHFIDEHNDYSVRDDGLVTGYRYIIAWDTMNVCFEKVKGEENTFQYTVLSKNNSKKQVGTVKVENDKKYAMIGVYFAGVFRVEFTEEKLKSLYFCKSLKLEIPASTPYIPVPDTQIDATLLKLLSG